MLQKIEIDWDIHKLIELERSGFDEPPYVALRRLLGLSDDKDESNTLENAVYEPGVPWTEDGVIVPHGSLARMEYEYGRQVYEGQFLNGKLVVQGQEFDTLSGAASEIAVTKAGQKTQLNGWLYWKAKFPGEKEWKALKELRSNANRG